MDSLPEDSRVTRPRPPEPVAGDYILERKLGGGAFGTVFQARHKRTGLRYAVKRLHLSDDDAQRFEKEALYPARIASDSMHVVNVIEFFGSTDDGTFYLVTELVPHGDLRQFLETQPSPLPVPLALQIVIGIAKGLTAIHAQGVIHRDLKPGNILMDRKDGAWIPKIADFGLARSAGSMSMGDFASPGYAAPEQLNYGVPGTHSDIFGLGMVVFEVMTGRRMTEAADLRSYNEFLNSRPAIPKLSEVRPELASFPELDTLLRELLNFDAEARTLTALECVNRLGAIERRMSGRHEVVPPVPMCRKCGSPLETGVASCRVCGTAVNETDRTGEVDEPVSTVAASWPGRIKTWLTIAGVIAVIMLPSTAGLAWIDAPSTSDYLEPVVLFGVGFSLGVLLHGRYLLAAIQGVVGVVLIVAFLEAPTLLALESQRNLALIPGSAVTALALYLTITGFARNARKWLLVSAAGAMAALAGIAAFWAALWTAEMMPVSFWIRNPGSIGFAVGLAAAHVWVVIVGATIVTTASEDPRRLLQAHRSKLISSVIVSLVFVATTVTWAAWERERPKVGTSKSNEAADQTYFWIPAGEFVMGCSENDSSCQPDELPSHRVRVTNAFWLTNGEVSVGSWKRVMGSLPPEPSWAGGNINPGWANDLLPIVMVTWKQASDYCAKIGGRLPTEAEWEYAARAGSKGARPGPLGDVARYAENSGDAALRSEELRALPEEEQFKRLANNHARPDAVMMGRDNAWGLDYMLGNVSEWVADDYAADLYGTRNGTTDDPHHSGSSNTKVVRGGDFLSPPSLVRTSSRLSAPADTPYLTVGFRCIWNKPE